MIVDGRKRVVIENITPQINCGRFPAKRVVGEKVQVQADVFSDGHDQVLASLLYRKTGARKWNQVAMQPLVNDRWQAEFVINEISEYEFTVQGWIDHFRTWQKDLFKKYDDGQNIDVDLMVGVNLLKEINERAKKADKKKFEKFISVLEGEDKSEAIGLALSEEIRELTDKYPDHNRATIYSKTMKIVVDRPKALFSTWYEMFPRSTADDSKKHGTFKYCQQKIPEIAGMGFDVLYLPPIHPIGRTNRKGKNNNPKSKKGDPGSPWAIGSKEGGHMAIHPELGTLEDFKELIKTAGEHGMEIAMDIAFQCSPDHPYLKEHPEWFKRRPDGSIQFAENPPKKYEDIVPINFETENWEELWKELKDVIAYWIDKGIRIFRVDNPHTKSLAFWEWVILEIKTEYPDIIFLSEAFTRPKLMYRLAKAGFTQSYTYFTWRNSKHEILHYMNELTKTEVAEFLRPNFWPNTPDILPEYLQYGGRPAFIIKLILAATLSSNYGIYGPAFELLVNEALPGREEYLDSEKYEIKNWNYKVKGNLRELIGIINKIRKDNPALQATRNIRFLPVDNEYLLAFEKSADGDTDTIIVIVNLSPYHKHSGWLELPLDEWGISESQTFLVHDLIAKDKYVWQGRRNYIEINPHSMPGHIFKVHRKLRRESDFDYYM
ncbi:MAG: alpha-1,4-glucan--maltose-1-phosphate maltosyltransferase [candidate division Zixibacteria bacterium]|nr:alpha-1,4-glucan--maltose-1-phosphate maltosyltransferase [candidate division Zixibacteria bacterium]NIR64929.1 alpha-1,4-glucan--maltose-1-phosphate maltosyltransferase [candidate division Zixibacteria bacterium]NIS17765.1 alpha-1,4-glucan--maltose-1-phosphate maltosyltransferase [candidate division Zixibacteria bacterium]NIS46735.1 alpha-1,4-glucan--maltose-1-phosphate maltosyltransferase [candidate division Zixibacteria bacterium]NIT54095.1 alpha-1,4-glucan--maltose-1-phosphate maltosyltr